MILLGLSITLLLTAAEPLTARSGAARALAAENTQAEEPKKTDAGQAEEPKKTDADQAEEPAETVVRIKAADEAREGAFIVSGIRIAEKGQSEPESRVQAEEQADAGDRIESGDRTDLRERALAVVTSAEGITWEIPLFWVTKDNELTEEGVPGVDCLPVLAFFVPDEYAVPAGPDGAFAVTLSESLSAMLEKGGGPVLIADPQTKITYILASDLDPVFLAQSGAKEQEEPIPELPDERRAPADGTYNNPSHSFREEQDKENGTERKEQPEEPGEDTSKEEEKEKPGPEEETKPQDSALLTREQLLHHCAKTARGKYDEDELVSLVDLIINKIQPRAVRLLKEKFPAFAEAAEQNGLGKAIGLYVYRMNGDRDGVTAHQQTSASALAYVQAEMYGYKDGSAGIGLILGVNTQQFEEEDSSGKLHIGSSEKLVSDLHNTIVHEMLHGFMYDYNRTGSIGTPDPGDFLRSASRLKRIRRTYQFPSWFEEGLASSVENVYQFRYERFQFLLYDGNGGFGDRHTAENLLQTYTTTDFVLKDGRTRKDNYDLEDPDKESTSVYVTGYLADLYLGEMAARSLGLGSSVTTDESGTRVSSEKIRLGLNSVLKRLHEGESLDEIIGSISGGAFRDVKDFEARFIKGTDKQGEEDSLGFVVSFLNYMQDIGKQNVKIPNGSILFDFSRDFTSPLSGIDAVHEPFYKITDSNDFVESTVKPGVPYTDGGKSKPLTVAAQEPQGAAEPQSAAAKQENGAEPENDPEAADSTASGEDAADRSACGADDLPAAGESAEEPAGSAPEEAPVIEEPAEAEEVPAEPAEAEELAAEPAEAEEVPAEPAEPEETAENETEDQDA